MDQKADQKVTKSGLKPNPLFRHATQNNGTIVWKRELGSRVQPSPVMGRAGPSEGEGPRDVLVVAAERGDVIGFDPLSGDRLWKSDLGGNWRVPSPKSHSPKAKFRRGIFEFSDN